MVGSCWVAVFGPGAGFLPGGWVEFGGQQGPPRPGGLLRLTPNNPILYLCRLAPARTASPRRCTPTGRSWTTASWQTMTCRYCGVGRVAGQRGVGWKGRRGVRDPSTPWRGGGPSLPWSLSYAHLYLSSPTQPPIHLYRPASPALVPPPRSTTSSTSTAPAWAAWAAPSPGSTATAASPAP